MLHSVRWDLSPLQILQEKNDRMGETPPRGACEPGKRCCVTTSDRAAQVSKAGGEKGAQRSESACRWIQLMAKQSRDLDVAHTAYCTYKAAQRLASRCCSRIWARNGYCATTLLFFQLRLMDRNDFHPSRLVPFPSG